MQFTILPKGKLVIIIIINKLVYFNCFLGLIPVRALIATQLFLACFVSYMLRVNMSLNIIAMVDSTATTDSKNSTSQCAVPKETSNISLAAAWVALPDVSNRFANSIKAGIPYAVANL